MNCLTNLTNKDMKCDNILLEKLSDIFSIKESRDERSDAGFTRQADEAEQGGAE